MVKDKKKYISDLEKVFIQEDKIIIHRSPVILKKYGKEIKIMPVNWYYDWQKFTYWMGLFMSQLYAFCESASLPTELPQDLKDLNVFKSTISIALSQGLSKEAFFKVCGYIKMKSWNKIKWMKRKFTLDDWLEIFIYVYGLNILGVKKNLKIALELVSSSMSN